MVRWRKDGHEWIAEIDIRASRASGWEKMTPEARAKSRATHIELSKTPKRKAQLQKLHEASQRPEAIAKNRVTNTELAKTPEGKERTKRRLEAAHTPEVQAKRTATMIALAKTLDGKARYKKLNEASNTPKARAKQSAAQQVFTPEQADVIRERLKRGETVRALAIELNVHPSTIYNLKNHRKGYQPELATLLTQRSLTPEQATIIRARLERGETGVDLAIKYGVCIATISNVKHHKNGY
jgi:hypothetical protein